MVSVVFGTMDHSGHVLSMFPFMYDVAVMVLSARIPDPICCLRLVSAFFLDFISARCVGRFARSVQY